MEIMVIIVIIKWIFNTASSLNKLWKSKILWKWTSRINPIKWKLNGVYSRGNLPKIKDAAYVINLDEYSDIGTH